MHHTNSVLQLLEISRGCKTFFKCKKSNRKSIFLTMYMSAKGVDDNIKRGFGKSFEIGINRVFPTINRNILIAVSAENAIFAVKFLITKACKYEKDYRNYRIGGIRFDAVVCTELHP
jgi:hypothetical protein